MTDRTKLRKELEVASRVAPTLNDTRSARELTRYIEEIEAQLCQEGRAPPATQI
jgi:hypothetical protein